MTVSEKIKTINNKIEKNKAQYNLDREAGKILALSQGSVAKYEFLQVRKSYYNQKIGIFTFR